MSISEEQFRSLLDARGILRPGTLEPPDRSVAYAVFAQRSDARLDVGAIRNHAARFFQIKLGLTVDKHYDANVPTVDAARLVALSGDGIVNGTRLCFARPADEADYTNAEAAEREQDTSGMALLARRCGVVWLVTRTTEDDRVSLTLAAILASTMLGPILSPSGDALFGVRTARLMLESLEGRTPYR